MKKIPFLVCGLIICIALIGFVFGVSSDYDVFVQWKKIEGITFSNPIEKTTALFNKANSMLISSWTDYVAQWKNTNYQAISITNLNEFFSAFKTFFQNVGAFFQNVGAFFPVLIKTLGAFFKYIYTIGAFIVYCVQYIIEFITNIMKFVIYLFGIDSVVRI